MLTARYAARTSRTNLTLGRSRSPTMFNILLVVLDLSFRPSVRPSVCLSVTFSAATCNKTAKKRYTGFSATLTVADKCHPSNFHFVFPFSKFIPFGASILHYPSLLDSLTSMARISVLSRLHIACQHIACPTAPLDVTYIYGSLVSPPRPPRKGTASRFSPQSAVTTPHPDPPDR